MQKDIINDDDFIKKLGNLKWHSEKPAWLNIDILNRPNIYDN